MNLLIDTDVLIDVAIARPNFFDHAAKVIDMLERGEAKGFIAWHSISNLYYMVRPTLGKARVQNFIDDLMEFISISPTTTQDVKAAVRLNLPDFEDSLQVAAALACKANFVVTRNIKHYKLSPVKAKLPRDVVIGV